MFRVCAKFFWDAARENDGSRIDSGLIGVG